METKKNKTTLILWITLGVVLIAGIFVTWKWMSLRTNVAKVATNTAKPTASATSAAIDALNAHASLIS